MSTTKAFIAGILAEAFAAGQWSVEELVKRGKKTCGPRHRWLKPLARRIVESFTHLGLRQREKLLRLFIESDEDFSRAWTDVLLQRTVWGPAQMAPAPGTPSTWQVPALATTTALADWLSLRPKELDWFADRFGHEASVSPGPLRHYSYVWQQNARKTRLLEVPKRRLKEMQRRLLHDILDRIPPHEAVHGYRRGRSLATYVAPHTGKRLVLHFDLRDFFPSIHSSRIHALFVTAGYPPTVARTLAGLCTNVVPGDVLAAAPPGSKLDEWQKRSLFGSPHLPQGAPTSPALANLCAYRFDCRLAGLARAVDVSYTRYADDLTFSGDERLERCARRFQVHVCRIALEEGFEVHTRKSRFMRQGVRQQIAGIVVNVHANLRRAECDRLKAILHNCVRHGPQAQNRDGQADFRAHLLGRIGYLRMLNPDRAARLRALFDQVRWPD